MVGMDFYWVPTWSWSNTSREIAPEVIVSLDWLISFWTLTLTPLDCNNRRHLPKPYDPYWSQPRSEASSPIPFKRCQHNIAGAGLLQAVSTCGYWHRHVSATHVRVVCPQTDWQPSDFSVGDEKWLVQPTSGNKNGPEAPQSYERKTPQGIMGKSKALTGPRDVREDKERWRQSQIRGQ